ncbi:MAG: beta-galactosidase [Candidatus Omnitrophica bacterium]|jgi:hypothetical protein|nr:beta-galactosidase [Candidatus Omnitrophota bacterium]
MKKILQVFIITVLTVSINCMAFSFSQYQILHRLSIPDNWKPAKYISLNHIAEKNILKISFTGVRVNTNLNFYLKKPLPLDTKVKSIDLWAYHPATEINQDTGFSLNAIFLDKTGKKIISGFQWDNTFIASHIGPPNVRESDIWKYLWCKPPKNAVKFIGFNINIFYIENVPVLTEKKSLFIKDIAFDRINYSKTKLYYVVLGPQATSSTSYALTEQSGGSNIPYVLLNDLIDPIKGTDPNQIKFCERPSIINLCVSVYNASDTCVYSSIYKNIRINNSPENCAPDFFKKILIPITAPGTYWITGRSYNAINDTYFTTDRVRLVIIKGNGPKPAKTENKDLLTINPEKPWDVLTRHDKKQIHFHIRISELPKEKGPFTIHYTLIPYSVWFPGFNETNRPVILNKTITVNKSGNITVPYKPKMDVEIVAAELWDGNKVIDREDRPIGIKNSINTNPKFTEKNKIPSLKNLTKNTIWINTTCWPYTRFSSELYKELAENIDQLKKLTPNIGISFPITEFEPLPGVYNWSSLTPIFNLAAKYGCRIIPYMAEKYPFKWEPVEFWQRSDGCVSRSTILWGYGVGRELFFNGKYNPGNVKQFNQQFARRYLNNPGLGGYYFEDEHIDTRWIPPWPASYDSANHTRFCNYLKRKYKNISKLNTVYNTNYKNFSEVKIPISGNPMFPKKIMFVDWMSYQVWQVNKFIYTDQVKVVRDIDPKRPIIFYLIAYPYYKFLKYLATHDCMIANGGVNSSSMSIFNNDKYYDVKGLFYRMEPISMWYYNSRSSVSNYPQAGFDSMIFGQITVGGRGLNFHIFMSPSHFIYKDALKPDHGTGIDKIVQYLPIFKELRDARKLTDPVVLMNLYNSCDYFDGPFQWNTWPMFFALYNRLHYEPYVVWPGFPLNYMKKAKIVFVAGAIIDNQELEDIKNFLQKGGKVVLQNNAAKYSLENPDGNYTYYLFNALGINYKNPSGEHLKGVDIPYAIYNYGKGQIFHVKNFCYDWIKIIPVIMKWANFNENERLFDSNNEFTMMHVLKKGNTYYLVTTYRVDDPMTGVVGPLQSKNIKLKFLKKLPKGKYKVTKIWNHENFIGIFTHTQLASGFNAEVYENHQMKIFKIEPIK